SARKASIAGVWRRRRARAAAPLVAIQCFRQRARDKFQVLQVVAREQVGMAETLPGEAALEQLNRVFFCAERGEGHCLKTPPDRLQIPKEPCAPCKFQTTNASP